jgi:hypothetical protein
MSPKGWGDNSQVYAKTVENEKRIRGAAVAEALCAESYRAGREANRRGTGYRFGRLLRCFTTNGATGIFGSIWLEKRLPFRANIKPAR